MKAFLSLAAASALFFVVGCTDSKNELNQVESSSNASMTSGSSQNNFKVDLSAANVAKGRTTYQSNCASCHGADGKGDGPAAAALNPKPRDHTNGAYMDKLTNAHIFFVIRNGGAAYGYPTMPAQPNLSGNEIKSVIAFVRSLSATYKP
jgi:mono/diheme cytochrome c family protein